jgi:threonylcarbamoyladenosine tRNA methylthiotransferase MtaB
MGMKVFLDTIGCKLNQSEIERYAIQFRQAGHELVDLVDLADIVVVNTCAVTAAASQDSRQKLRVILRKNPNVQVIATGCLVSLDDNIADILPGISRIVPNDVKDTLVSDLFGEPVEETMIARKPVPGERSRTRAFIKAQDGCDHYCTYCITRLARGKSRSIPFEQVQEDIRKAIRGGAKEVILTGVQLGSWGKDIVAGKSLYDLIASILENSPEGIRIRLSSVEPWDLDEHFFTLWQDERLCPHLHLPLQSGSDRILKLMGRKIDTQKYRDLLQMARRIIPRVAITTDIIVGFPGETEDDFRDSLDYVREMQFASGHVFHFSAREGTSAAQFRGQIHGTVKQHRSQLMRSLLDDSSLAYRSQWVGRDVDVLWESVRSNGKGWILSGWSEHYIRVESESTESLYNHISKVQITGLTAEDCQGKIISD